MKKLILPAILLLITCASAQSQSVKDLFQQKTKLSRDFHRVAGKYDALRIDKQALGRLRNQTNVRPRPATSVREPTAEIETS